MENKTRLRKPEHITVRGICMMCNSDRQASMGNGRYRPVCQKCHYIRAGTAYKYRHRARKLGFDYLSFKKESCEKCRFVATDPCQLDIDHIDGNPYNNNKDNLQTLCANCHRLKTKLNRDWENKGAV